MTKHGWWLWLVPIAVWAVYMCWLTGFQNGYEAGHTDGWASARRTLAPSPADQERENLAQRDAPRAGETAASMLPH